MAPTPVVSCAAAERAEKGQHDGGQRRRDSDGTRRWDVLRLSRDASPEADKFLLVGVCSRETTTPRGRMIEA